MASAPAAKRAVEQPAAKAESRATIGPQLRDPKRYHVLGEHGRGGLGRVQRAHDRELGRDVAIKELISRNEVHEVRFLREALITARLEHPGIVPVHEAGRWPDGTPFYAMKLVSGRSLRDLIAECTTSDERIGLLHHVIAVADAIAYAHGRNIIHRDLKPANVIVGEFGETIVIDWGLAKDLTASEEPIVPSDSQHASPVDEELTVEGSVLGTPAYMAPEQGRGEAVDQRADVFAIGTMLWELCAARRMPPNTTEARHRILRRAGIDRDLITIIDNALAPDPEKRYPDAGALAADLKAFKSGVRISARHYTLWAMLAHWTRRHRSLALAIGAAVLIAAVGSVVYVRNIAIERDRADSALTTAQKERDRAKLSEASLVLDKDPNRAGELLSSFTRVTSQVALLTSRARPLSAKHIIPTSAGVDGLSRARGSVTADVRMSGELHRLDLSTGLLTVVDRNLTGALTYRGGEAFYTRRAPGARTVRVATPSNINAVEAGQLDSAWQIVALSDSTYVLDLSGDLHRLDGMAARVVEHGVHGIAGDGDVLLVCRADGELDVRIADVIVLRRRCPQTKTLGAMAVVGNTYASLTDQGTLLTGRAGQTRELLTDIRGEYELALSNTGLVAMADYGPQGKTWFVRADGSAPEPGPVRASQPWGVAVDGPIAAWGYADGTVVALDSETGMTWELHGHPDSVGYVIVDAANARVVSASRRELRIWSIKPPPSEVVTKMPCSSSHIAESPDGSQIAMDCNDGSVWIWARKTGVVKQVQKHVSSSFGLEWARGKLCSGSLAEGRIVCSDADGTNAEIIDSRSGKASWLSATPDRSSLVFASVDGKVWRYDGTLHELYAHSGRPNHTVVSDDGRLLASCAQDGSIVVFDLVANRLVERRIAHVGAFCGVSWSGKELWSSGDEGTLKRWSVHEGLTLSHVTQASGTLRMVKVVGAWLVAAEGSGVLTVRLDGGRIDLRLDTGGTITALDASREFRYVAASVNQEIIVVDLLQHAIATLATGAPVQQLRFLDPVTIAFSEPAVLKTIRVDRLDFVAYQFSPERASLGTF